MNKNNNKKQSKIYVQSMTYKITCFYLCTHEGRFAFLQSILIRILGERKEFLTVIKKDFIVVVGVRVVVLSLALVVLWIILSNRQFFFSTGLPVSWPITKSRRPTGRFGGCGGRTKAVLEVVSKLQNLLSPLAMQTEVEIGNSLYS